MTGNMDGEFVVFLTSMRTGTGLNLRGVIRWHAFERLEACARAKDKKVLLARAE